MKKSLVSFSIAGLSGLLTLGLLFSSTKKVEPVKADTVTPVIYSSEQTLETPESAVKYIEMKAESFQNGIFVPHHENNNTDGVFADVDARYWGDTNSFAQLDTFFRGEANEEKTNVDLSLKTWTQYTQYIYFQWGGAANFRNLDGIDGDETDNEGVVLRFHVKNKEGNWLTEQMANDTFVGNPMVLRYYRITDEHWAELDHENGFEMYIQLIDTRSNSYAFHNFGYLHVNQTEEEVGKALRKFFNTIDFDTRNFEVDMKSKIRNNYTANALLNTGMHFGASNVSEDFEDRDTFYEDWLFDTSFGSNHNDLHFDKIIGTGNYRPAYAYMPFNKEGNGFFRGWHESGAELDGQYAGQGFVGADAPVYRFVSAPYTLNEGAHYVSIKMAGTASLQVLNPSTNVAMAEIKCQTFDPDPDGSQLLHETNPMNTCTMRRHIINLSAFAGQTVRFAICDYRDHGWGAVYFDDFNCDYNPNDGIQFDVIEQVKIQWNESIRKDEVIGTYYTVHADVYVPSTNNGRTEAIPNNEVFAGINYVDDSVYSVENTTDTSPMVAASAFVNEYAAIKGGNSTVECENDVYINDTVKALLNTFKGLSSEAKAIVVNSDDYYRATMGVESEIIIETNRLGVNIVYLGEMNGITDLGISISNNNILSLMESNTTTYVVIPTIITAIVIICIALFTIKKRKMTKSK